MPDATLTYWVITPELRTDEVVTSLRNSWLSGTGERSRFLVASGMSKSSDLSLHWLGGLNRSSLVADGRSDLNKQLKGSNARLHEPEELAGGAQTAVAARRRADLQREHQRRENHSRELTRLYNNFLRHKVFEIMRQMCRRAVTHPFDFAFMMDADTAVNQSNLQLFVNALGSGASVYSGLCRRRSWGKPNGQRGVGGGPGILFSQPLLQKVCRIE